jgi:ABC-type Mn2+/Zn2+ transport system ATPase subunit
MLEAKKLQLKFGATTQSLDFDLIPGSTTWLKGKNGAGKTTLLLTLLGFVPSASGEVVCEGKSINPRNPSATSQFFAYLPQKPDFNFGLSVARIIELAQVDSLNSICQTLGIDQLLTQDVTKLSGGEAQRVLLSIILSSKAKYVLLDEPFASQDVESIGRIKELIKRQASSGRAFLIASHISIAADQELVLI